MKLTLKLLSICFRGSSVTHTHSRFIFIPKIPQVLPQSKAIAKKLLLMQLLRVSFYTHSHSSMCDVISGEHFLCFCNTFFFCCFTDAHKDYFPLLTQNTHETVKASKWVCRVSVSVCCGAGASIYG